eukprot:gi/632982999/ref/XP_007908431.1/ PREDICTED: complement C4-like [Callorhinchus milii]
MWVRGLLLCLSAILPATRQTPSYMITGPNIMHVGVEESVSVQLHGAELPVTVTVYCWDIIRNTNCSDHVGFHLNAGNSFQEIRTIRVSPETARNLQLWRRHQHYVTLVAESDQLFRRRRMVHVRLSSKRGYIFIRTDKSIYTPEENVRFSIFTLDHHMRPVDEEILFSVFNSKNMQITADIRKSGKILLHHIRIPDNAAPGNWRIEAQFSDSTMSKVSTQFEVKEFVLPRFEIKIKASEMFYLVSKDEFSFKILAIHTYGERVDGKAYVRFGILDQNGNKTNLGGLEQELRMKNGEVSCSLKTQDLLEQLKMLTSVNKLVGSRLYVALTVFETASGELEETEVSGIPFVATPYVIDLSKTRRHFAPGLPFPVVVLVTSPDQSPTPNIPVTVEGYTLYTDETGTVVFEVVAPANASVLSVNITAGEGTRGREFSQAVHIVHAYQSVSRSYLHMYVQPTLVRSGQVLTVQLEAVTEPELGDVDYIYYLVTNKGRVVRAGKTRRLEKTELTIPVDVSLVPTFRLIAYYYIGNDHRSEMVANSLWVDVKDECEGKIEVKEMDQRHAPGSDLNVILSTDDAADVAMVAVDSAVYIVNNKYKLTARKVFEAMNSYDLGCYYGGGANTVGVFMDAGLTFLSDVAKSEFRKGYSCEEDARRQKRSLDVQKEYTNKLNQYTEPRLRKCCTDGLTKIPMRYSCGRRVERVRERRCRAVFLLCCQYGIELRRNQSLNVRSVARSLPLEFEEFFDETSIHVRSIFPHSWLWGNHRVQGPGNHTLSARIPDSITTWEIQAVAMFDNKGFCVAESKKLTVFQEFFISMRLPNAVTRNEQVDVRVILYNYLAQDIQVFVYMRGADGLCSPATSKDEARVITVRRNSAHSLGFPIVPLVAGNIPIHVVALSTSGQRDALLKHLRVVEEGVMKTEETSLLINPLVRRSHDINTETPLNQVPDTESYLYIKARGDLMGESIENSLSPEGINRLIRVPTGCAEQTAMHLAPTVYAVEYLDQSQQWLHLPSERKDQALANIKTGYTKILEYQKADGSYGTWKETPSSVWLTAFMVKILSIARKHIIVNDMFIHKSVSYLINAQNSSGHFEDPHPVMAREMQGGVESLVSMTAFVTIALQHSLDSYKRHDIIPVTQVKNSIAKALGFLHKEVPSIKHPFVTAIAAYALTLASPDSPGSVKAHRKLKDLAYYNREKDIRYWKVTDVELVGGEKNPSHASALAVEATSYALLQSLMMKDETYASTIAKWLTEQRNYGGGFRSTQDTVVALEALSTYHRITFEKEQLNMDVEFSENGRMMQIHLQKRNALSRTELKFPLGSKIQVKLSGTGNGTLNLLKTYRLLEELSNPCTHFKLEVTIQSKMEYLDSHFEYNNTILPEDQSLGLIGWHDLRSRRKREVVKIEADRTIYYTVCTWREDEIELNEIKSGMAVVDISLLSGFEPDTTHLEKLKNGVDKYIDQYELKDGKVLLYLDMVRVKKECVVFAANQVVPVGLVQPATATLYDFYNPSVKCTVTYSAPEHSVLVSTLCHTDVCECAEGPCPHIEHILSPQLNSFSRIDFACYSPVVDYAFKVQLLGINHTAYFEKYVVNITQPILNSRNEAGLGHGAIRHFLNRRSCPLKLRLGSEFLIMGKEGKTRDHHQMIQYVLDSKTWIEEIPSDDQCLLSKYRNACKAVNDFIQSFETNGCKG